MHYLVHFGLVRCRKSLRHLVCPAGLEPATFSSGGKRGGRDKTWLMQGDCREVAVVLGVVEESAWQLEFSCRGVA